MELWIILKSMNDPYGRYTLFETVAAQCEGMKSEQTYPYEDKDKDRDKVVGSRDGVFIGQTEEVHDGGTHAQYTLDFVPWRLVCIDGPDLRLCRRPGSLPQVNLQTEKLNTRVLNNLNFIRMCVMTRHFLHVSFSARGQNVRYLWDLKSFMSGRHYFGDPLDVFM